MPENASLVLQKTLFTARYGTVTVSSIVGGASGISILPDSVGRGDVVGD